MRKGSIDALPLSEHPYERGQKDAPEKRRLDYWVLLPNIEKVLWIEYKHKIGYINRHAKFDINNIKINDLSNLKKDFKNDVTRLKKMKLEKYEDLCGSSTKNYEVAKITLVVLPICRRIEKKRSEELSSEERKILPAENFVSCAKFIETAWKQNEPKPNLIMTWSLPKNLQTPLNWPDNKKKSVWWDIYYGVYFLFWINLETLDNLRQIDGG
jgi:hypothetical protein